MKINLSLQVRDDNLCLHKYKDTLIINGHEYDFSRLPDGAVIPNEAIDCEYIVSDVERIDGVITLTVLLPITWDAKYEDRIPAPILNAQDGLILEIGGNHVD